tara:strand:- start:2816 stop:3004 length:189 start_codon:yes stop_codon:yes gene_type:complete
MTKSKKLCDVLPGGKKNRKKRKRQHQDLCNMMNNLLNNKVDFIDDSKKINELTIQLKSKVSI